ncbi:MAG: nitronate monooxygenase [Alphaproteobacteria bacterium]|nr:nitronate monooxygenase [Alphaproteobacteria bacterium]
MTRRFRTAMTERLGIEAPVILAPMGGVAGGALAAAVTRAGGLGLIGVGYAKEDWIEQQFDAAGNTPVGIGFITWDLARAPARLDVALSRKPRAVMLSFGDASPFADRIKKSGAALIMQVQSLAGAKQAAALGADIVVAQGIEAGGHGADPGDGRSLLPLVPAVVDGVRPIPVAAAGGIADGRGLAAALVLGAGGVLVGTRFYAATESLGHANAKRRIAEASADATVRTRIFDTARAIDWPDEYTGRALVNDFARQWHGREPALQSAIETEKPRYLAAAAAGDTDTMVVWAGQGLDLIQEVLPAGEIVSRLLTEADRALSGVG